MIYFIYFCSWNENYMMGKYIIITDMLLKNKKFINDKNKL